MTACPRQAHLTAVGVVGGTGGLYNESYTYDATTGNLSSKAGVSYGYQDSSHFHAVTHLDSVQKYWYDANGNMTERNVGSDSYELIYDADNRLVAVEKNQTTVGEYTYDGDGNRVKSVAGGVTTYYIGNTYEWRVETSGSTGVEYYYAGSQRVAMRVGTTLSYLFGDHLGSTSITTDASGSLSGELRYLPFGETRYASGQTPTSFRYTGQREEAEVGLYFYGARWYDPYLNRWIQPDTIIPSKGEGNNSNVIGYIADATYSALIVDYHEKQFLEQLNQENKKRIEDSKASLPSVSTNPLAFDRYAYAQNNPIRYIDPTGHTPTAPPPEWLEWLGQNVKIIWKNAPPAAKNFLFQPNSKGNIGTRILTVDHPHGLRTNYWHINSDLKLLETINHKNIEPLVGKVAGAVSAAKTFATNTGTILGSIVPKEVFGSFIIVTPEMFESIYPREEDV